MCAMSMILRYSTTIPNNSRPSASVLPIFCRGVGCVCIRKRRRLWRQKHRPLFWALFSCRTDTDDCPKPMCVASAIGCGVCATAGDRAVLHARKWSHGCARGSRMPIMPIHGDCAMRSFEAGGLIRFGSLTVPPERVLRGGSWYDSPWHLRSANRDWFTAVIRYNNNGFRVLRRF